MAVPPEVLSVDAANTENKEFMKYTINPDQARVLDAVFYQHYIASRPGPSDYKARTDLILVFNAIAKEIYGNSGDAPSIVAFGSFLMDLFCAKSDLDLSVMFMKNDVELTRQKKIQTLRKFTKKFYALQSSGHVSGVQPVLAAKVPILKVVDCGTHVECDLSVDNMDGISKSELIRMICSIDERFQILSFLMKAWAKAQNINDSKGGTLNSLSVILLVSFHLQTRQPPILPPFSALLKDGTDPAAVEKVLHKFVNYGKNNKESVAELFISLLIKLSSVELLWPKGLCASVYNGSWTSKSWKSKIAPISVEDFVDPAQNVARSVGAAEMKKIYRCIHYSLKLVLSSMNGQIDGSQLSVILFGKDDGYLPPMVSNSVNMLTRTTPQDPLKFTASQVNPSNIRNPLKFTAHTVNPSKIHPQDPFTFTANTVNPSNVRDPLKFTAGTVNTSSNPPYMTYQNRPHYAEGTQRHVNPTPTPTRGQHFAKGSQRHVNPTPTHKQHFTEESQRHVNPTLTQTQDTHLTKRLSPVDVRSRNIGERFTPSDSMVAKRIHYEQEEEAYAHGVIRRGQDLDLPRTQPRMSNRGGQMHTNGGRWVVKQPPVTTFGETQREAGMSENGNGSCLIYGSGSSGGWGGSSGVPQYPGPHSAHEYPQR